MKTKFIWLLFVLLFFALGACTAVDDGVPAPGEQSGETEAEKISVDHCPQPVEGTHFLLNPSQGYCFLYPDNYDVFEGDDGSITLYQKSLLNTEAPFASIERQAANGEPLEDITAQRLVNFALPESEVGEGTLGGQPAIILDNLPGQDTNRRLVSINNDFVYDLIVARIGADYGPVGEEAEVLFDQISSSFQFTGIEPEAPLLAGPECPDPLENTTIYRNEPAGYCFLLPAEYSITDSTVSESDTIETIFYINSIQDVDHARLFVTVEDAAGRSLEQVTAELESEIESAVPNSDAIWSFGYMLDGVPANQFDQVPGQDFSRQLLFVHDDRIFTLTFIPDDPQAGQVFQEMETLYDMVVDTFSFLWTS